MKRLSLLALVLALSISLTGCFGGESKLYNAFNKMQDVNAIQTETTLELKFQAEGFPEEAKATLEQVAAAVNNTKIQMKQKTTQNKDKTSAKAEMDMELHTIGEPMKMKVWVVADMSEEEPKLLEIIKMPEMLRGFIFQGEPEKEYLVYDMKEIMDLSGEEINFGKMMEFSKSFQPKLTEFMKEMQKDFKPGFDIVKSNGNKTIGNQKLDIYELRLDDATLKELVRYGVNYSLENEVVIEFIKEYMEAVMNIVVIENEDQEEAKEEIKKELEELEAKLPEFKEKFNEFMDKYKDIEILGEKGIVIEYGINEKGYIAHEKGDIDLVIDLEKIAKTMEEEAPEMKGVINLGISYTSRNYNINSKVLGVMIPKVNEKNSISIMKLMEKQMEQMQQIPVVPAP